MFFVRFSICLSIYTFATRFIQKKSRDPKRCYKINLFIIEFVLYWNKKNRFIKILHALNYEIRFKLWIDKKLLMNRKQNVFKETNWNSLQRSDPNNFPKNNKFMYHFYPYDVYYAIYTLRVLLSMLKIKKGTFTLE